MDRAECQTDLGHSAPPGVFARTLSQGIRARRLTLKDVRDQLAARGVQVSAVTLSYWMRGRTQPERPESLRAVSILEDLLGLPTSTLMSVLPPPRARGPRTHVAVAADFADLWRPADTMQRLVEMVGAPDQERLCVVAAQDRYIIGADRSCLQLRLTQVVRAQENGVDRVLFLAERAGPGAPTAVSAARGGVLGRVRTADGSGGLTMAVAEVLLDQVLSRGETAVVECVFDFAPGDWAESSATRRFGQPARYYLVEVDFDQSVRPVRCLRTSSSTLRTAAAMGPEIRLGRSAAAHSVLYDVPVGIHGLQWDWE